MNLGAFAVIAALQRRLGVTSNLSTFAGLVRREPTLALLMTLFLLSLTGIPPTAGFFAKAYVILAAVQAGGPVALLAVIAVLNAAAAAFYYLRVVVYMFMREPGSEAPALRHGRLVWAGLAVTTAFTIALGVFPGIVLDIVGQAARAIVADRRRPRRAGRTSGRPTARPPQGLPGGAAAGGRRRSVPSVRARRTRRGPARPPRPRRAPLGRVQPGPPDLRRRTHRCPPASARRGAPAAS